MERNQPMGHKPISGTIYSYTIVHLGFGHMADRVPYALVLVDGDDGDQSLGIALSRLEDISIGKKVAITEDDPSIGKVFELK